jgi:sigma-B regulation protein RsbU (phosphoserine phosphatase)
MSDLINKLASSKDSVDRLRLVAQAAHVLNSTLEYEELMRHVLELVTQAVGAEAALVFRYDQSRQDLKVRYFSQETSYKQMIFQLGQGFVGWVAEHKDPVLTNKPTEDSRFSPEVEGMAGHIKIRSLICLPMFLRGRFFGVVEAVNKIEGDFDQSDLETISLLADQIALAIRNAQLYRTARRDALQRDTLYQISKQLSSSLTLEEVLNNILQSLSKVVEFQAGGVFVVNEKSMELESRAPIGYEEVLEADLQIKVGQGLIGWVARAGEPVIVPDTEADERYINARPKTNSEIVVPMTVGERLIGVFNLENDRKNAFSQEDLNILTTFASQAAISIDRARLLKIMLDQKQIDEQLRIARHIQSTFLPDKVPHAEGFDMWGTNIPSGEVGGDYFDFIKIVEHQIGVTIADVSGKGIPASLIMAAFRASLIAEIRNNYAIRSICQKVNNLLYESVEPENYVTAIYGVLDTKNSIFTFSNCGHNPGLLLRASGELVELSEGGMLLGVQPDTRYEERPLYLEKGDILCLYTDGIPETTDGREEQFETRRMIEVIDRFKNRPAAEIGKEMLDAVHGFAAPDHMFDDLTVIIIRRV